MLVYAGGPTILDTGPIYSQDEAELSAASFDIRSGTGWYTGLLAKTLPGGAGSNGDVRYVQLADNDDTPLAGGERGRYHRAIARNFKPEASHLAELEIDINGT